MAFLRRKGKIWHLGWNTGNIIIDAKGKKHYEQEWISLETDNKDEALDKKGDKEKELRARKTGAIIQDAKWEALKQAFFTHLKAKKRDSPKAVDSFQDAILRLESVVNMAYVTDLNAPNMDKMCEAWRRTYPEDRSKPAIKHTLFKKGVYRVSDATLNKTIVCLKSIGTYAVDALMAPKPLLKGYAKYSVPRVVKERVMSQEEIKRVFKHVQSPSLLNLLHLCYYAGLRLKEACNVRKGDFLWEKGLLRVNSYKTQETSPDPEYVPLHKDLIARFRKVWNQIPGDYVCAFTSGTRKGQVITPHRATDRIREIMHGLDYVDCSAHTLRHSFITHLVEAGVDSAVVIEWARWKDPSRIKSYLHLSPNFKNENINRLPSVY